MGQREVSMRIVSLALLVVALAPLQAQTIPRQPAKFPHTQKPKPPLRSPKETLVPLTQQERAQQILNRFTFGPRPGDLEQVLAITPERWFEQQLNPAGIPDSALEKRLADYPTLNLQPDQALLVFPDRGTIQQIAEGKRPYPTDSNLAAMYEVQVYKFNRDLNAKKINADGQPAVAPPTEAEAAEQKKTDQAAAARIAGQLFSLPRDQRMAALIQLPVP